MNVEERMRIYREWVAALACAIYNNEEDWGKRKVISFLCLGDPSIDYDTWANRPTK